ncbi:MAG: hypothetical protein KF729_04685 [Sandaracinaceae bacterium]|nr:hypothetical protein [Sandaracinaceae bacterium]
MRTLVCLILLAVPASGALAQDVPRCHERRPGYVECEETRVTGAAPDSFLLLSRSRVGHDPPALRRDLLREVRRSVRRAPF